VEDRKEFDSLLISPLPGRAQAEATPAQIEQEGAEFMSFLGAMNPAAAGAEA
jgi:hypothetical protein